MEYEKGTFKAAVISVIKVEIGLERITELIRNKERINFTTTILDDKVAEITIKYYDDTLLLVTAHLPKIRMSLFFIPVEVFGPMPEAESFAGRFGKMRL